MKKILSLLLIVSIISAFAVVFHAEDADQTYEHHMPQDNLLVEKLTGNAPTIDAEFDGEAVWGAPLFDITGNDAYLYSRHFGTAGLTPPAVLQDKSWAVTDKPLWNLENGSVEAMKETNFKLYARWDDEYLYMCYVITGWSLPYYYNEEAKWEGNGIQIAFGPENQEQNYFLKADDPEHNGQYVPGYVANEYVISIAEEGSNKAATSLQLGKYRDGINSTLRGLKVNAKNDATNPDSQVQIYEMAFGFKDINRAGTLNEEIPFATAFNFNVDDQLDQLDFNGFQVGQGIYQQHKTGIWDSICLELTGAEESTVLGDVNGDFEVNDADVIALKRYISKWNITVNEGNADVDGVAGLSDSDVIRLKRFISKWNVTLEKPAE